MDVHYIKVYWLWLRGFQILNCIDYSFTTCTYWMSRASNTGSGFQRVLRTGLLGAGTVASLTGRPAGVSGVAWVVWVVSVSVSSMSPVSVAEHARRPAVREHSVSSAGVVVGVPVGCCKIQFIPDLIYKYKYELPILFLCLSLWIPQLYNYNRTRTVPEAWTLLL